MKIIEQHFGQNLRSSNFNPNYGISGNKPRYHYSVQSTYQAPGYSFSDVAFAGSIKHLGRESGLSLDYPHLNFFQNKVYSFIY